MHKVSFRSFLSFIPTIRDFATRPIHYRQLINPEKIQASCMGSKKNRKFSNYTAMTYARVVLKSVTDNAMEDNYWTYESIAVPLRECCFDAHTHTRQLRVTLFFLSLPPFFFFSFSINSIRCALYMCVTRGSLCA